MTGPGWVTRKPYVAPSIRDYGDLVELTATVGGGFQRRSAGRPDRFGLPVADAPSCFSH